MQNHYRNSKPLNKAYPNCRTNFCRNSTNKKTRPFFSYKQSATRTAEANRMLLIQHFQFDIPVSTNCFIFMSPLKLSFPQNSSWSNFPRNSLHHLVLCFWVAPILGSTKYYRLKHWKPIYKYQRALRDFLFHSCFPKLTTASQSKGGSHTLHLLIPSIQILTQKPRLKTHNALHPYKFITPF